jgi:hypothetical protein
MNLNYHTTETEFLAFADSADRQLAIHSIAIDHDGEVIIDAEIHFPHISSDKYKHYTHVRDISLHNMSMLKALYRSLRLILDEGFRHNDDQPMKIAA